MNEITINNCPISIKEYNSQRVVTFKDIDAVHQRPSGTASRNFRANRERFIENEDYFLVNQPDEIRRLGITRPQGGTPEATILLTESGYLMLVKSFTDDLAWNVQRQLVNCYFKLREQDSKKAFIEETKQKIQLSNHYLKLAECKELTQAQRNKCIESAFEALGDKIKIKTAPNWDLQEQAEYILEKLAGVDSDVISLRELCRKCRKFSSVQELRKPVEYLIKSGYLCEVPIKYRGTGRRSSPIYKINL